MKKAQAKASNQAGLLYYYNEFNESWMHLYSKKGWHNNSSTVALLSEQIRCQDME